MIGWFRSRAGLLAELREARDHCVTLAAAWELALRERDQAREQAALAGSGELRKLAHLERARADALAQRVELLQAANMAADQR